MILFRNEKGVALITALMMSLITLSIIMYLMYMITGSINESGANKRYKTVLEASYGSSDLIIKEIFPILLADVTKPATNLSQSSLATTLNLSSSSDSCLQQKLTRSSSNWTLCSNTPDASTGADITLTLPSASLDNITVFAKIVETICSDHRPYPVGKCTGSDLSGVGLDAGSGVAYGSSGVAVQQLPATYRVELVGQRSSNPSEKSKLSILYSY